MRPSSASAMLLKLIVIASAALTQAGNSLANAVTPRDFGGKGDVVVLRDGSINDSTPDFRSRSAAFTPGDVGKAIVVSGAGPDGLALVTKIQRLVSHQQVALEANANTTVTGALTYYGTDDTAAIRSCVFQGTATGGQCTISDGVTFMVSNTKSAIIPFAAGHNPISKGTIDGNGRIIFAPQGALTPENGTLFRISSQETHPMPIAAAISKGASSFTAQDPSDAATLSPADWVIVTERDSGPAAEDTVYVDWMDVSSVNGAVVHTAKPFRMAFPNARSWSGPPRYWGLSFRKVGPVTSNVTIRDITIIVPKMVKPPIKYVNLVGIATRDTRGTVVSNVSCQDASGNCFAGYLDQGLSFQDNHINGAVFSEFASDVDAVIAGNRVSEPGTEFALPGPPTSGGLEVDLGTGFSSVTDNTIGPTRQVCVHVSPGVHDTIVKGNTCGLVTFGTGASCIFSRGGYRMTVTENTCTGGTGTGRGIDFDDAANLTAPIYSDGNKIFNNRVQGFATGYVCAGGRLRTDTCDRR